MCYMESYPQKVGHLFLHWSWNVLSIKVGIFLDLEQLGQSGLLAGTISDLFFALGKLCSFLYWVSTIL